MQVLCSALWAGCSGGRGWPGVPVWVRSLAFLGPGRPYVHPPARWEAAQRSRGALEGAPGRLGDGATGRRRPWRSRGVGSAPTSRAAWLLSASQSDVKRAKTAAERVGAAEGWDARRPHVASHRRPAPFQVAGGHLCLVRKGGWVLMRLPETSPSRFSSPEQL